MSTEPKTGWLNAGSTYLNGDSGKLNINSGYLNGNSRLLNINSGYLNINSRHLYNNSEQLYAKLHVSTKFCRMYISRLK